MTTARNVARLLARYLPDSSEEIAAKATAAFFALVRGEYWLQLELGTRKEISAEEMNAHVDHCVKQIHKLYDFK